MRVNFPRKKLEEHVKRICRSNLKTPCKICKETCPIIYPVLDVMEENNWKYNKKGLGKTYQDYKHQKTSDAIKKIASKLGK